MHLLLCLFRVCHLSIMLTALNGYVLFAANINDFKTIARELVPGNLADQIAGMTAPAAMKYKETPVQAKTEYQHRDTGNNEATQMDDNENKREYVQVHHNEQSEKSREPKTEYYDQDTPKNEAKPNKNTNRDVYVQEKYDDQSTEEERESTILPQEYEDEQVAGALRSRIEKLVKDSAVTQQVQTETQFDIDVLVEKVKERLEKQFEEKYIVKLNTQKQSRYTTTDYNNEDIFTRHAYKHYDAPTRNTNKDYVDNNYEYTTKFIRTSRQTQKTTRPQNEDNYYGDLNNESTSTPDLLFDKIDMTAKKAKDSYEDYVIPPKDNIFESNEKLYEQSTKKERLYEKSLVKYERTPPNPTTSKSSYRNNSIIKFSNNYESHGENLSQEKINYHDYGNTPEQHKAKTEHLSYDYRFSTDKDGKENAVMKHKKGTNIPTREHYKMSSPNYAAKIPVRAEKYDFNEPLPEKDRDVEDMKHFINPPAFINGRVVLRDGMSKK